VRLGVLESRRTLAIYIAAGASFAALSARGLTVPLYAHGLGAGRFQVGALFAVATLAAAALSMPSGLLIDRFGARSLLIFSIVVAAGSQLAAAAATTVLPLFIWQVVGGLGGGAQQAALFSAVTESVKSGRLGRAMGWLTFSMQAGFFIGPSIAGLLLNWLDIRTDLAVTTAMLILTVPGALLASGTAQSTQRGLSLREPLRALVSQRSFLPVVIGLVSATLAWGTIGAFLPIFGKEALRLVGGAGRRRSPDRFLVARDRAHRRHSIHGHRICRDGRRLRRPLGRVDPRRDHGHVRHGPFPRSSERTLALRSGGSELWVCGGLYGLRRGRGCACATDGRVSRGASAATRWVEDSSADARDLRNSSRTYWWLGNASGGIESIGNTPTSSISTPGSSRAPSTSRARYAIPTMLGASCLGTW
jgi:hypothetical protein